MIMAAGAIVLSASIIAAAVATADTAGSRVPVPVAVDWASFLARSDPINSFDVEAPNTVPDVWLEGSFTGNGMLGAQVLICPGGLCHQSLLLGANTSAPDQRLPHQAVVPLARGDVSDVRSGAPSPLAVRGVHSSKRHR